MSTPTRKPREFTGRHMLAICCAFFGVDHRGQHGAWPTFAPPQLDRARGDEHLCRQPAVQPQPSGAPRRRWAGPAPLDDRTAASPLRARPTPAGKPVAGARASRSRSAGRPTRPDDRDAALGLEATARLRAAMPLRAGAGSSRSTPMPAPATPYRRRRGDPGLPWSAAMSCCAPGDRAGARLPAPTGAAGRRKIMLASRAAWRRPAPDRPLGPGGPLRRLHRRRSRRRSREPTGSSAPGSTCRRSGSSVAGAATAAPPIGAALDGLGYAAAPVRRATGSRRRTRRSARADPRASPSPASPPATSCCSRSRSGPAPTDATRDLFHWLSALIAMPALAFAGRSSSARPGARSATAASTWTCRSRSA